MKCARDGCPEERGTGNKGRESYCRGHRNEIARAQRHAGKAPEVVTSEVCQRAGCDNAFQVSSWGQAQRYCSQECRKGAPKAGRAVARVERKRRAAVAQDALEFRCGKCTKTKPRDDFYIVKGRVVTWRCKECQRDADRAQYEKDPARRREVSRLSQRKAKYAKITYGGRPMTPADFDVELVKSGGICFICQEPFQGRPDVDHDHATGIFRGLLCRGDNIWLNHKLDAGRHQRVAQYLGLAG